MNDIHPISGGGGGGGRFFGGGERRLRPNQHPTPPLLKCPRCDSLNTKFCYFNNYNLSQPRHFCKSCRRYWTKGGVLRNVPVGGGCRKSKRSNNKQKTSAPSAPARKSSSHSSSESSGLTGTTAAASAGTSNSNAAEVASTTALSAATVSKYQNSGFFLLPASDPPQPESSGTDQIFPDIGNFTNMMAFDDGIPPSPFQYPLAADNNAGSKWATPGPEKIVGPTGVLDRTDQMDFMGLQNRVSDVGLATLDWNTGGVVGGDQELFDLTGAVDQTYWSQTHWG